MLGVQCQSASSQNLKPDYDALRACIFFHGFSDFMKYWKRTWNWRYGNCYTFNSGATGKGKKIPVMTSTKPGPKYGKKECLVCLFLRVYLSVLFDIVTSYGRIFVFLPSRWSTS